MLVDEKMQILSFLLLGVHCYIFCKSKKYSFSFSLKRPMNRLFQSISFESNLPIYSAQIENLMRT